MKHDNESRINRALPARQNEDPISLNDKPAIAQEVLHNVYFKTSSETSEDCLKRICSLISSSHQKLIDYQSRNKCHVKWGPPISINRQTKESLIKGPVRNNRSVVHFRRTRVLASLPFSDQFDLNSSSDSDNNIVSRNDSDEEWNEVQEKGRSKRATKRKASLPITKMQQTVCPKQKKSKSNTEMHRTIKDNQLPIDIVDQHLLDLKPDIKVNAFEHNTFEARDKADISVISTSGSLEPQSKTKSFRKSFQLQSNLLDDPNSLTRKKADEVICSKRPMVESTNITSRDSIHKKKKLSGNSEESQSFKGSQDLFVEENELPIVNESDVESSYEKSRNNTVGENQDGNLTEGMLGRNVSISTEKGETSNSLEVSIIEDPDVQCPMCNRYFPRKEIEVHASDCDGFPPQLPEDDDANLGRKLRNYPKRQ